MAEKLTAEGSMPNGWGGQIETFQRCSHYYAPMDFLLYLEEDLSYRADRVDHYLTLLWHPTEDRAIGVKLKGFRFIFQRMQAILSPKGITVEDSDFFPFISALEVAMTAGAGAATMAEAEQKRREEKYQTARAVVESVRVHATELKMAA